MEWILTLWNGEEYRLPSPLYWRLEYGLGTPCDSFLLRCPYGGGEEEALAEATRLTARWEGAVVFRGVVDECQCCWDAEGGLLELSGRGLAALLLDNEAQGADFGTATLEEILRRYVTPFGISRGDNVRLPPVSGFSVQTGSSCWQVLYQFARYHGGVAPRLDPQGRLMLSPLPQTESNTVLDGSLPVLKRVWRYQRYGVLSKVRVVNRVTLAAQDVVDDDFQRIGGCASRVLTVPRRTGFQTMRYSGRFQLDKSKSRMKTISLTLGAPFVAFPGELLRVNLTGWQVSGLWRVTEAVVEMDQDGYKTRLELGAPEAVL